MREAFIGSKDGSEWIGTTLVSTQTPSREAAPSGAVRSIETRHCAFEDQFSCGPKRTASRCSQSADAWKVVIEQVSAVIGKPINVAPASRNSGFMPHPAQFRTLESP